MSIADFAIEQQNVRKINSISFKQCKNERKKFGFTGLYVWEKQLHETKVRATINFGGL